jgi:2-succinyl-6-hydroxy-2,4-cyclohexadiene-1-carboxylate synthase
VVLLHGFTQSSRSWGEVSRALADRRRVVCIDAPGHGKSSGVTADLPAGADLMMQAAESAGAATAAWVGYSMGGRFALHVALRHSDSVERLVLVSTTAGIEDPAERQERRRSDEKLAGRLEAEGVEPFVRWWVSQPLFATLHPDAAGLESRLGGTATGLASSLRHAGAGTQEPLWEQVGSLSMPVLVVAGELDGKYAGIGARLASAIGTNASLVLIEGAGHACHLEKPDVFVGLITEFLAG